ncbi:MAG: hypothetical protein SGJ10_01000 [Bacteroidota bacterium]|nr:hypothetical protein [Bacteroidota bacterium]
MKNLISMFILSVIMIGNSNNISAYAPMNSLNHFSPKNNISSEPPNETLISSTAEQQSREVNIHWTAASDQIYYHNMLEILTHGKDYFEIETIKGNEYNSNAGELQYTYKQALANILYYRIKQVDIDGNSKYLKTIKSETKKLGLVSSVK